MRGNILEIGCKKMWMYLTVNCPLKNCSIQLSLRCIWLFATPRTTAHQVSLSITNSWTLLKLMSIKSMMPSKPPHPLSSPSPPAFTLSQHQGLFQWASSLHQVAKVLELQLHHQSFQILPFPFQPSSSSFHGASSPLQILNQNIQDWLHTGKQFLWSTWPYPLQIYS